MREAFGIFIFFSSNFFSEELTFFSHLLTHRDTYSGGGLGRGEKTTNWRDFGTAARRSHLCTHPEPFFFLFFSALLFLFFQKYKFSTTNNTDVCARLTFIFAVNMF